MSTFLGRSVCRSVEKKEKSVKIGDFKHNQERKDDDEEEEDKDEKEEKDEEEKEEEKEIIRIKIRYKVLTMIVIFSLAPRHFPCYFVSLSHGLALTSFSSLEILFLICWYFGVFLSFIWVLFSCYEAQKYF